MRYAKHNDVVLDTFGGSGSTLIACEQTGRVCRTMVLDPKYCDVIRRRWAEFVHGEGCDWQTLTPTADTGEEKDRIKKAQEAYSMAEGLVDKYAAKLRSAQDETRRQAGSVKPQGSFYARAASALRGNMMDGAADVPGDAGDREAHQEDRRAAQEHGRRRFVDLSVRE